MISFIRQVLEDLLQSKKDLSSFTFVLPSKRAGSFLLHEISRLCSTSLFAPQVYSIEEFTQQISGLQPVDNTISLFEFYEVYMELTPESHREEFETFSSWAQTLIHDFQEIDRYLIPSDHFFNYLAEIKDMDHWYLKKEKTPLMENYLHFWHQLPRYYQGLKTRLIAKGKAYQGLIYRTAAQRIGEYSKENPSPHIFIGFNALNTAEQKIIHVMLDQDKAAIHWDIDQVFLQDPDHSASMFINQYRQDWPYYKKHAFPALVDEFSGKKAIEVIGVSKDIDQAKYLGELLYRMEPEQWKGTAVVLGEEELLLPVLNSLPKTIQELNITMGYPLKNSPLTSLFEKIFQVHLQQDRAFYYREVLGILKHPALHDLLRPHGEQFARQLEKENQVYLKPQAIIADFPPTHQALISACFGELENDPLLLIQNFQYLIQEIRIQYKDRKDSLGLEYLYQYHLLFNKLLNLIRQYPHIKSISTLHGFFREILSSQSLDFQGKPFSGLQIMGMLESRALDFDTVIITSVNEGILPSGKSGNSFLPYDLKKAFQLPTYREKNAVYTYHFYRLLQRARKIYLLYTTASEGMNKGEKSRFITQLEIESPTSHHLIHKIITPKVPPVGQQLRQVRKSPEIVQKIKALAGSGFSPSALTTYIRNPLDFYYRYVVGIKEREDVEETVAFNTLGTVIHDSLETFYKTIIGKPLTREHVESFLQAVPEEITRQFRNSYSQVPMNQGKNLIIFEAAKRYLSNFLKLELKRISEGEDIQILQVEEHLKSPLEIPDVDFPVFLRGKVDRVEKVNGIIRIIDYKTGKVQQNQLEISDWELIGTDYDRFSKSFQILAYASLIRKCHTPTSPLTAGIISFKNLNSGFLKFSKKEGSGASGKKSVLDEEILEAFEKELKKIISEICDPEVAFIEKDTNNGNY